MQNAGDRVRASRLFYVIPQNISILGIKDHVGKDAAQSCIASTITLWLLTSVRGWARNSVVVEAAAVDVDLDTRVVRVVGTRELNTGRVDAS